MKPTDPVPSFGKLTKYRGIQFKSQAEARWAALFDMLGLEWEYEPNGPDTFPDFLTAGKLYEVKGALISPSFGYGDWRFCHRWLPRGTAPVDVEAAEREAIMGRPSTAPANVDSPRYAYEWNGYSSPRHIQGAETTIIHKLPSIWFDHPDARKVRHDVARLGKRVTVLTPDCNRYDLYENAKRPESPAAWDFSDEGFGGETEYDWPRTLVMVTGRGKV